MNNLLMDNLPASGLVFVLGLLVVFFGMAVIVLVLNIIGSIMKKNDAKKKQKEQAAPATTTVETSEDQAEQERVRVAIVAAITAYYFNQGNNCQFKIKKIKRI